MKIEKIKDDKIKSYPKKSDKKREYLSKKFKKNLYEVITEYFDSNDNFEQKITIKNLTINL